MREKDLCNCEQALTYKEALENISKVIDDANMGSLVLALDKISLIVVQALTIIKED